MKPLVVLVGPTGVGKTRLSLALAHRYGGEIISGDAMTFYRGLDIGTAKLPESRREGIPHHLIDILDPGDSFSVAEYQKLVRGKIAEIRARNAVPFLVGGSGLYVQAVLCDYRFEGEKRDDARAAAYAVLSNGELHALLAQTDPKAAETTHPNNRVRVLRLLELAASAGPDRPKDSRTPFYGDFILIGLEAPRPILYAQIDGRVGRMMEEGLLAEVRRLYDSGVKGQAVQAIGYKELYAYFEGKVSLAEAVSAICQASRNYAKRQMTWFKNQMRAEWFESRPEAFGETLAALTARLDPLLLPKP